jgi:hypothetical protein
VRLVRKIATPFRQYVNRHFEMVKDEVRGQHEVARVQLAEIGSRFDASIQRADAMAETAAAAQTELQFFVGRQMAEVRTELGGLRSVEGELRTLEARLRAMEDRLVESGLAAVPVRHEDLRSRDKVLANRMIGHDGYQSQAGLWVNDPLSVGFEDGNLALNDVNERIVEIPYVLARTSALPVGSTVLDIGCCESTVALHLASLGHRVTALDPRPYPFAHPNLTVATTGIEAFRPDTRFDAAILLSTIEHLGVGSYGLTGAERLDLAAMAHVRGLLAAGGVLVLTTPFGRARVDELERTYDVAGIRELLTGYRIVGEPEVAVRVDRTTWVPDPAGFADVDDDRTRVVMLTAHVEPG